MMMLTMTIVMVMMVVMTWYECEYFRVTDLSILQSGSNLTSSLQVQTRHNF